MVQALIGDVKDFWGYSTFSDWVKIGDFRDFRRKNTVFWHPNVHKMMYFLKNIVQIQWQRHQ